MFDLKNITRTLMVTLVSGSRHHQAYTEYWSVSSPENVYRTPESIAIGLLHPQNYKT
jgi:hypothetical protein